MRMKTAKIIKQMVFVFVCVGIFDGSCPALDRPQMFYSDNTYGRPFAKDPDVVKFKGEYYMYYSVRMKNGGDVRDKSLTFTIEMYQIKSKC